MSHIEPLLVAVDLRGRNQIGHRGPTPGE